MPERKTMIIFLVLFKNNKKLNESSIVPEHIGTDSITCDACDVVDEFLV